MTDDKLMSFSNQTPTEVQCAGCHWQGLSIATAHERTIAMGFFLSAGGGCRLSAKHWRMKCRV